MYNFLFNKFMLLLEDIDPDKKNYLIYFLIFKLHISHKKTYLIYF